MPWVPTASRFRFGPVLPYVPTEQQLPGRESTAILPLPASGRLRSGQDLMSMCD